MSAENVAPAQWRQIGWITLGALAVFAAMRLLPTGTNLNHMDFRTSGKNSIEFATGESAVHPGRVGRVAGGDDPREGGARGGGRRVPVTFRLRTASGKPIAPEDLVVRTRRSCIS